MTTTRPVPVPDSGSPAHGESDVLVELADAMHQVRRGRFDVRLGRREGIAGPPAEPWTRRTDRRTSLRLVHPSRPRAPHRGRSLGGDLRKACRSGSDRSFLCAKSKRSSEDSSSSAVDRE